MVNPCCSVKNLSQTWGVALKPLGQSPNEDLAPHCEEAPRLEHLIDHCRRGGGSVWHRRTGEKEPKDKKHIVDRKTTKLYSPHPFAPTATDTYPDPQPFAQAYTYSDPHAFPLALAYPVSPAIFVCIGRTGLSQTDSSTNNFFFYLRLITGPRLPRIPRCVHEVASPLVISILSHT